MSDDEAYIGDRIFIGLRRVFVEAAADEEPSATSSIAKGPSVAAARRGRTGVQQRQSPPNMILRRVIALRSVMVRSVLAELHQSSAALRRSDTT